ncbi:MAG: helix-turn-helix transcriptional regulator [Firmicutes bacterium]|nr:helix-turn-helix transcriptional regulator [Bacillota bacterium]
MLDLIIFTIFQRVVQPVSIPSTWAGVLSYVMENLKDVKFSEAVKIFGTSESYFCRMFKQDFSMTFKQFVIRLRIQQAKELLLNTNKSVSEIYEQCGYNNN